ncbi:MAG TPA: YigZ family protein, partial [Phnomibacter sp.]|nr:YigZ family protein [Phnomibacter sp.]
MSQPPPTHYKTIARTAEAEFKDRGSRFLAFAAPVDSIEAFKAFLQQVKARHPKAAHHCLAYRIGPNGSTFIASDDGEPAGSAGRPILGQIDSKGLTNTAVIVVRYFGGTLLGVPGLINAYKTSTALALQLTPTVEKAIETPYMINCSYPQLNEVLTLLRQQQCTIGTISQGLFCTIEAGVPIGRITEILYLLHQIPQL